MPQRCRRLRDRLQAGVLRRCSRALAQGSPPRLIRLQAWLPPRLLPLLLPPGLLQALLPFWLFERSSRPAARADQILLLRWILDWPCSSLVQRRYALVALAYRAVDGDERALADRCLPDLLAALRQAELSVAAVQIGAADPACFCAADLSAAEVSAAEVRLAVGSAAEARLAEASAAEVRAAEARASDDPPRESGRAPLGGSAGRTGRAAAAPASSASPREHPFKWLLSLHTTLYHLGLVLDQRQATLERLSRFCRDLDPDRLAVLDPDVACRISSNLMRCLMLCWLQAWADRQPLHQQHLQQQLEQLTAALNSRHRHHPRQRYHLQSATTLRAALQELQELDPGAAAAGPVLQRLAGELVRSAQPALPLRLCGWFSSRAAGSAPDGDRGSSGPCPRT